MPKMKSDQEILSVPSHALNELSGKERARLNQLLNRSRVSNGNQPVNKAELSALEARVKKLEALLDGERQPGFVGNVWDGQKR